MKTLRKNDRGPEVRVLQEKLTAAGYPLPATGFFGTKTDTAVRNFQRKKRMLADGVVGPNTWLALGFTDTTNAHLMKPSLVDSLLTSLGALGTYFAGLSQSAPNSNETSQPVSQLRTSEKGLQFIYTREAQAGVSNVLHWPGEGSGVTLGPGYDMKERTETEIINHMIAIGVNTNRAKQIAKAARLVGADAKQFCITNKKIVILDDSVEFKLLKLIVPRYENEVRKKITVNLMPYEFDALVSFAYNLGEVWSSIASHINNGNVRAAMNRMKDANKSNGKVHKVLVKRRDLEIALYMLGNYGKLRIV